MQVYTAVHVRLLRGQKIVSYEKGRGEGKSVISQEGGRVGCNEGWGSSSIEKKGGNYIRLR